MFNKTNLSLLLYPPAMCALSCPGSSPPSLPGRDDTTRRAEEASCREGRSALVLSSAPRPPPQVPGTLNVRDVPACPWLWMENLCPSRRPPTPWSRSPPSSGLYSCSYSHHLRHRQCVPLSWVTSVRAEAHSAIHGLPEDLTPQSPARRPASALSHRHAFTELLSTLPFLSSAIPTRCPPSPPDLLVRSR